MKMKNVFLVIIGLFCVGCSTKMPNTYEEGIKKCEEQRDSMQLINPKIILISHFDCLVGSKIPSIKSRSLTGKEIDSKYFSGKSGVINFWFEGCPPCVAEIPILNRIVDSLGQEEYFYLAIGRDDKIDILSFLQTHPWKFDQVENGKELIESVFKLPWGYPISLIVDKNGVITHVEGGINENDYSQFQERILMASN